MGRREILVTSDEALQVLDGRVLGVRLLSGEEVDLRLATPDELLRMNRDARAALSMQMGYEVGVELTREQAERAVKPFDVWAFFTEAVEGAARVLAARDYAEVTDQYREDARAALQAASAARRA